MNATKRKRSPWHRDVLNAQTALTEAHGSFVDALHNYSVARASLLRATGSDLQWSSRRR
jgi:outer membrane protein TolC